MKKVVQELDVTFETHTSDYPEDMHAYRQSWRLAKHLALGKARHVAEKFPNSIIIGADTFITCGHEKQGGKQSDRKIGKPTSIEDAKRLIRLMSGKIIGVYSGVAVIQTDKKGNVIAEQADYALTKLHIKKMSPTEVDLLAHQKDALHISGAFSIEGEGGKMITKIDGDYDNVIGLPLFLLKPMLRSRMQGH
jgi:septum formation protein